MKRTISVLVLSSVSILWGQAQQPRPTQAPQVLQPTLVAQPLDVTRVVTLKNPNRVSTSVIEGIGLIIKRTDNIVVLTGPQGRVDTAEAILRQLDVPPPPALRKNVQLTAWLIIASMAGTQDTPLPKELQSAVNQVASVFPYKAFNVMDAIELRLGNTGGGSLSGVLPRVAQVFPGGGLYTLTVGRVELFEESPVSLIRVSNFMLKVQDLYLNTNVDMREGQKIVVGKVNIDGTSNALIVILTAKVVD